MKRRTWRSWAGRELAAMTACWLAAVLCGRAAAAQLDNGNLVVSVQAGAAAVTVATKGAGGKNTSFELVLCGADGGATPIERAEMKGAALRVSAGGVEADLTLGKGRPYVTVTPAKAGGSLEVRARSCYAVLPDFFGYDVVYEPRRFTVGTLLVPAENFLLNFVEGNRAIVMCVWPGGLANAKGGTKDAAAGGGAGREPIVELNLAGEGDARRVTASRIEFIGGPVHVAVLEHEGLWHDQDVSSFKALTPVKLEWKRPFDAHWRLDTLVAEGKKSADLISRSQSYRFLYAPQAKEGKDSRPPEDANIEDKRAWVDRTSKIWKDGWPRVYEERTYGHVYQAWFNNEETYVALQADDPNNSKKKEWENVYDRILIYPLDRDKAAYAETPLEVYTFVDIMRETLGQEPCAYVLDLEGIKGRGAGGDQEIVDDATCSIWGAHVSPLVRKNELTAEEKAHLVRSLKDLTVFLHAVNARIVEYAGFNERLLKAVEEAKAKGGPAGAAAQRVGEIAEAMKAMLARDKPEDFKKEVEHWDEVIAQSLPKVEAGEHKSLEKLRSIRNLGQDQDNVVADCRRFVKAARHEASFVESTDPEVQKFVLGVRDMCQEIMRNPHPKELLHTDPNSPRMGLSTTQRY